ncbi:DUF488 family protein [Liquorilactobacillus satsumensis]|uniref:DUF488 domain-containing protein n=1 Tax=Liquorilactobacillus satsumensis TaxID=259059 RepID=UPI0021C33F64|nr:DUF488 family protein [Liquorilactobacillus satsumensis]MCP9312240.1 DUF488 family protein [Liquorilactobacillus satsumensis]MCP9328744.1 DUF488 family protein [Liquorilactobacillus satsumensis]MCP9359519.1 DUF488 family protein [Liquorilactobacillus satsumensis]
MQIKKERIYTKPVDLTGYRILVDRLWPRGISKVNAHLDLWFKEIAPSNELRKWYGHEPEKFAEFKQRYLNEIAENPHKNEFLKIVKEQTEKQDVILLFGAKDLEHNQAAVLAEYLQNIE